MGEMGELVFCLPEKKWMSISVRSTSHGNQLPYLVRGPYQNLLRPTWVRGVVLVAQTTAFVYIYARIPQMAEMTLSFHIARPTWLA